MSTWNFSINTVCHVCGGAILLLMGFAAGNLTKEPEVVETIQYIEKEPEVIRETVEIPVPKIVEVHHVEKVDRIPQVTLSQGEKEVIAKVVFAEAAYEDMIGKQLVVDTILNRIGRPGFGDTVFSVVYAEGQYCKASMYSEECMEAVEMECMERLDERVVWFCNSGFMPYGEPAYQHGNHYFSRAVEDD